MRVTHLNTNDIKGGASKAAYRLNQALKSFDINSNMLVKNKQSNELGIYPALSVEITNSSPFPSVSSYLQKKTGPFSTGDKGLDVSQGFLVNNSDIIHLHWINGDFLSIDSIKKIGELKKVIVWTLHDMWAFTGGCHYSDDCVLYEKACGYCPFLNSKEQRDLANLIWEKKHQTYQDLDLTIVTCSFWLAECARKSTLFKNHRIEVIPNTIDIDIYKPIDRSLARKILNLPTDKYLILFGAMNAVNDERKGYSYLQEALGILSETFPKNQNKVELMVFGASHLNSANNLPYKVNFLGTLTDDFTLGLCYNAADVFVAPSLQDNLPNTIMEALSCGTPVVAFNTGGIPDLIVHHANGYLAEHKSSQSLADGIQWVLENNKDNVLGIEARNYVKNKFSFDVVANKYIRLYEELIKRCQKTQKLTNIFSDKDKKDLLLIEDEESKANYDPIDENNALINVKRLSYNRLICEKVNDLGCYDVIVCSNILQYPEDIISTIILFNRILRKQGLLICNWDLPERTPNYHLVFIIENILSCLGFYKTKHVKLGYEFIKENEVTEEDIKVAVDKVKISQKLMNHLFTNDGIMTGEFIDLLFNNLNNQCKVGIFGAGEFGKKVLELTKLAENLIVECFFDNEKAKWGKTFCNLVVYPPEFTTLDRLDKIIIGSIYGKLQIEKQLVSLGIGKSKIIDVYGS